MKIKLEVLEICSFVTTVQARAVVAGNNPAEENTLFDTCQEQSIQNGCVAPITGMGGEGTCMTIA